MVVGLGRGWSNQTLTIHPRRHRISSDAALEFRVNPIERRWVSGVHTSGVLRMADNLKIVREDDGFSGLVDKPGTSFESQAQAVFAVCGLWEGQVIWRGEFDDDSYIRLPFDLIDELGPSLITEEGAQPVFERGIVDLTIGLDYVRGSEDHDELGVVGWLVGWASLAHGV